VTTTDGTTVRSVVVTGGSTGIGLETARRFGQGGDGVVITGRTAATLEEGRRELERAGIEVAVVHGSVGRPEDVRRVIDTAVERFGGVDVLVNNAGAGPESPIVDTADETWDDIYATNVRGPFLMSREVARTMIDQGRGGSILFTSSINALRPTPPAVAYSSAKASLDAFIKGLAVELAPHGIRVCGVNPGYIDTPMLQKVYATPESFDAWVADRTERVPLGRFGRPEEIAAAFWFLASSEASYITGTSLVVDGGRLANP
jgi:glucose 1-dehydrogenase